MYRREIQTARETDSQGERQPGRKTAGERDSQRRAVRCRRLGKDLVVAIPTYKDGLKAKVSPKTKHHPIKVHHHCASSD
jgi:hypothetical protein